MSITKQYIAEIQAFLDYLQFEKRYSINTVEAYQNDLEQFFAFLTSDFDSPAIPDILPTFVRTWLASLKSDDISSKSINRKASSLKSFFKYQLKIGKLDASPMVTVHSPKISNRLPEFVLEEDLSDLFNHVEFTDDWKGKTERIVLLLLYSTGMRVSELINVKEGDVDFAKSQIKVLGKGNKERIVPLAKDMLD